MGLLIVGRLNYMTKRLTILRRVCFVLVIIGNKVLYPAKLPTRNLLFLKG